MTILQTRHLSQNDIFKIVHEFDQHYFGASRPIYGTPLDNVIVITQFTRMLFSHFPIEIVDEIMRHHLKNSSPVSALLAYYKNTPTLAQPSPLAGNTVCLNNASKSLLLQFNQLPQIGELACYRQLMTSVFRFHFTKLALDEQVELIYRIDISLWDQKSPEEKLELLETQIFLTKFKFQLMSWKTQSIIAQVAEKHIIGESSMVIFIICFFISALMPLVLIGQHMVNPDGLTKHAAAFVFFSIFMGCVGILSMTFVLFSKFFFDDIVLQSINKTTIDADRERFSKAHFPDPLKNWLLLTASNDTDTGS